MSKLNEEILDPIGDNAEEQLPPGWQLRELTDILTPEQFREFQLLWNKHKKNPENALLAFKQYFQTIAPDLEAKGVLPGYLAYAMYAKMLGVI